MNINKQIVDKTDDNIIHKQWISTNNELAEMMQGGFLWMTQEQIIQFQDMLIENKEEFSDFEHKFFAKTDGYKKRYGAEGMITIETGKNIHPIMIQAFQNSLLADDDRILQAQQMLRKELNQEQQQAILNAYSIGKIVFMDTIGELMEKSKILRQAGFKSKEIQKLIDYWIC